MWVCFNALQADYRTHTNKKDGACPIMSVCSPITAWIPPTACSTEICWLFANAQQRPGSRILTLDMSRCLVLTRLNVCWPTDRLQWLLHIKDQKQAMVIPFRPISSRLNSIFKAQVPFLDPLFFQKVLRHPTQAPGQGGAPCRLVTDSLQFSLPWFLWEENVEKQIFRLYIYINIIYIYTHMCVFLPPNIWMWVLVKYACKQFLDWRKKYENN